jgi:hypothetical protein
MALAAGTNQGLPSFRKESHFSADALNAISSELGVRGNAGLWLLKIA